MLFHSSTIQHAASDTLNAAVHAGEHGGGEGGKVNFGELLHHVYDSREIELPFIGHVHLPHFEPLHFGGLAIDLSPTKHVVFLWLAALMVIILAITAARKISKSRVPHGIGNLVEAFVLFVRDEICIPNMGAAGVRYMPYLLTTFFFILFMNLSGLVPYGATATSNVSVTGGLALIAFIMIQASAMRAQGFGRYLKHLTGGVHWSLWPIMVPIEVLGLFTKPFALMVRLFANMIGGHIVIVSLIGLIFIFKSYIVAAGPVVFVLGISMLELFVAFLQAYIFTMLTSLFMGLGMAHSHEGDENGVSGH
ncbi:MAG: F0F1 ATP synthase subunit A [Ignavibacteriae bacterium]|nr:F0F1 ATP synthase subunit A [Ignavibacteria bacterium]MBI3365378.1 F0F1 ATP synthase subunit A [Ignavibacteriota bacterium]